MRLLIVSNRLPVTIVKQDDSFQFKQSVGGLVSGISDYLGMLRYSDFLGSEHLWIGYPGVGIAREREEEVSEKLMKEHRCMPVFLSEKVIDQFYHGFCNKTVWPLFHSFPFYTEYDDGYWRIYEEVNRTFAEHMIKVMGKDDIVWIHDYHLMLLPQIMREKARDANIIFFLHIPFPNNDMFLLLPRKWRTEILRGILGADVVGFHTYEYLQNFLQCVLLFLGHEHEFGKIAAGNRLVKAGTFPMGIHFDKFYHTKQDDEITRRVGELKTQLSQYRVLLSIDRLDYTKGIINRLKGYEGFLKDNPQYQGKVVLLMVIVPSRIGVEHYEKIKKQIDELVGKINGEFGNVHWTPILYQTQFMPYDDLVTLYSIADVMLVTPLRDGMNLVAKEYIASRTDGTGVLILSETAGAAKELTESMLINPNDISEISASIKGALEMPAMEQKRRNKILQGRLRRYDIIKWGDELIRELIPIKEEQKKLGVKVLNPSSRETIVDEYRNAQRRTIFLDYDGTLVPFARHPMEARPDSELLRLLGRLSEDRKNKVVLLSGRDKNTLYEWFSALNVGLVAEHGIWIREKGKKDFRTIRPLKNSWKEQVLPMLNTYSDRLPGSFVEEKDYSIVLHYRQSDPEHASVVLKSALENLIRFTANIDVHVLQGSKNIEVRCSGVNKGTSALRWLAKYDGDFVMAIGDDLTDEDLFKALPPESFTIKVGITQSHARYNIYDHTEVRELLGQLIGK